jgi:ribosomal protein L11 methyltransferase
MTSRWVTVIVEVPVDDIDLVSGLLWSAGVAGVEEIEADSGPQLRAGCDSALVDAVLDALGTRWPIRVESVEVDAGLDAWRDHAEVWRAGERFVIVPPWLEVPTALDDDAIVLSVDPGHAFGSGSHTTTRDCLAMLERLVAPDDLVVDIGCGSGVLAIAAILLGGRAAIATDIDDRALIATAANAERCGVADRVEVGAMSPAELDPGLADVVVANIGAGTITANAEGLLSLVGDRGALVVSGLLDIQVEAARVESGEWCTIELRRAHEVSGSATPA